ncbi:thioredoxin domain-containing protein [Neomegalonema perideroedes]|uniref:hypothetical protein n=1 Tax=Neomegalonema perideroedes TaxID=217219 RepID=UPI0003A2487F|nr:hypothetical protein [Neomegalonema perideroedes]
MRKFGKRLGALALGAALAAGALLGAGKAEAAELLMFEDPGCIYCEKWRREIGPIYPRTREGQIAPIRFLPKSGPRPPGLNVGPIIYSPTFVLVERGQEIGRIVGYPGPQFFWGMLARNLERLPPSSFQLQSMGYPPPVYR